MEMGLGGKKQLVVVGVTKLRTPRAGRASLGAARIGGDVFRPSPSGWLPQPCCGVRPAGSEQLPSV